MGRRRLRPTRRVLWTALAALAVLAADFASKRVVQQSLELGERHDIIPGWVVLTHIENTGAAYGLLAGQRWLLVISAGTIALLTPFLLKALPARGRFGWAGPVITGMILGGALGNLIQRAAAGYVTDFIQTPPIELFQVFNIADAAISVAITGLVIISLFGDEKELGASTAAAPPEARAVDSSVAAAPVQPANNDAAPPAARMPDDTVEAAIALVASLHAWGGGHEPGVHAGREGEPAANEDGDPVPAIAAEPAPAPTEHGSAGDEAAAASDAEARGSGAATDGGAAAAGPCAKELPPPSRNGKEPQAAPDSAAHERPLTG